MCKLADSLQYVLVCDNVRCLIYFTGSDMEPFFTQQHRDWAKLGFIRGITLTPSAYKVFSSSRWMNLFLRIVGGNLGEANLCSPDKAELKSSQESKLNSQLPKQVIHACIHVDINLTHA